MLRRVAKNRVIGSSGDLNPTIGIYKLLSDSSVRPTTSSGRQAEII